MSADHQSRAGFLALAIGTLFGIVAGDADAGKVAGQRAQLAGLDAYIEQARRDWQVPGIAVGVILEGEVIYARGFGVRELGRDAPVDEHTRFQIGSMSKAFTAAALGLLVDEGRIEWDDPVIEHIPWFRLSDPWLTQQVTIRDLVAHRTGISGGYAAPIDNKEMVRRTRYVEPSVPLRAQYLYSNLMYRVAGQVVAEVTGKSWEEFIRTRIFQPLGMTESGASPYEFWDAAYVAPCMYCQAPAGKAGFEDSRIGNVAMPHRPVAQGLKPIPWQSIGQDASSGGLVSSLDDMLKWLQLNLSRGELRGKRLLRESTLQELHAPQMQPRTDYDWVTRAVEEVTGKSDYVPAYTLGWRYGRYRGMKLLDHTGALAASRSYGAMLPERRMGVVVLGNAFGVGGSGGLHEAVSFRIFDALLGAAPHDWSGDLLKLARRSEAEKPAAESRLQRARLRDTRPSLPLDRYVGEYENDWFGHIRVDQAERGLTLRLPGAFDWRLEHWHNDIFRAQVSASGVDMLQFFVTFHVDEKGEVSSFDAEWEPLGGTFLPIR